MRDPDPGSWLALRGRRRASPEVEGWVVRFDRAFNLFHPGTCGLKTGPNIINLTVEFILKQPSCKDIPRKIVKKLTNGKYWHRLRELNDELKLGVKNPNPEPSLSRSSTKFVLFIAKNLHSMNEILVCE